MAERDAKAGQIIRAAGGELLAHYYTLGRYDFMDLVDLPSTEALAKCLIDIGKWGTVSTETMMTLAPEEVYRAASAL
ncbi:MAG: GYD domain-containing protein [Methanomicrobiales archaeon]|nr:GYD domain-containing protein [Methanomicrobiales archaeon]